MAYFLSRELQEYNIAAVAVTPGYLRSEAMLERFGVTEENWRDAIEQDPIVACFRLRSFQWLLGTSSQPPRR